MKRSSTAVFTAVFLLIASLAPPAGAQTCPKPGCDLGLTGCTQYIANPELVHGCGWTRQTTAGYVDLTPVARSLTCDTFTVPANEPGNLTLHYEIEIFPSSPGTEEMQVDLLEGFTVLGTLHARSATDSGGEFSIPVSSFYKGKSLNVRFRRVPGSAQGNTTFRIQKAYFFALVQNP